MALPAKRIEEMTDSLDQFHINMVKLQSRTTDWEEKHASLEQSSGHVFSKWRSTLDSCSFDTINANREAVKKKLSDARYFTKNQIPFHPNVLRVSAVIAKIRLQATALETLFFTIRAAAILLALSVLAGLLYGIFILGRFLLEQISALVNWLLALF